ncbi:MAG: tetratricopeptide repeat protein [Pseudomonadota bacterium]
MSQSFWLKRSFDALSRRKVFRAAAAYAVPAWLLVQIADTLLEAFGGDEANMRLLILALLIGFPIVLILAWLYDLRGGRLQRTRDGGAPASGTDKFIDLGIIAACAAGVGYIFLNADRVGSPSDETVVAAVQAVVDENANAKPSVAVLPFENNSDDPANAIFADGLAEDVLIRLSKIEQLRVPGRTSSFKYKDGTDDLKAIAQALGVRAILEGSVQAYQGVIKVSASLVDAADSAVLWSESYTREMTNVFAIQEEIARAVADALKIELLGGPTASINRPTESIDAYRLYLRGRNEWHKRTSVSNAEAIDLFQRALALDDQYAEAWSGLADAYNFASNYGNMEAAESINKAREAAEKALELDPDLPEAYASLGLVLSDEGRFPEAAQAYERAIALNPNFANAHMWYGSVLSWVDIEKAVQERRIAAELEPLSPIAVQLYGEMLAKSGEVDAARREFLKIVDFAPEFPLVYFELAGLSINKNDFVSAIRYLRRANELDPGRAATMVSLSQVYLLLGDVRMAKDWLDRAIAIGPDQQQVKNQQLEMLLVARDLEAMEIFIDQRLTSDTDFFAAFQYRSAIALQRGNYADTSMWIRRIFARFNNIEVSELDDAQLLVNDETLYGIAYLANAELRSGNEATGRLLGQRLLDYIGTRRELNLTSPNFLYAEIGAHLALNDLDAAVSAVRRMADAGFPGYRQMELDILFEPIRGELEFKVSLDDIRQNATRQLAEINQLET